MVLLYKYHQYNSNPDGIIKWAIYCSSNADNKFLDEQQETIVSRIHEIKADSSNGQRVMMTKGDANPYSIPGVDYPIFQHNYIGKVVHLVNKGNITTSQNLP